MRNLHTLLAIASSVVLMSCQAEIHRPAPEILHAVSTDAVMVYYADRLEDVLKMAFDSTDAVRGFSWGRLSGCQATVSFVFNRKLSPVLCINAGRASEDTLEAVPALMRQAEKSGFQARYYQGASIGRSCNIFLLTRSEAVSSDVRRHIESGRSIMDLEDFVSAFGMSNGKAAQLVRNSAFDQILPKNYLSECFKRQELVKFARNFSDWIVITPSDNGKKDVATCQKADDRMYANMLPRLNCAESLLPQIMPEDTQTALSLPIGNGYRETYENWRYACSSLDKYKKALAAVKNSTGTDPVKWEKQTGVKEVAIIQWGKQRKVLAIRGDRLPEQQECDMNKVEGFTSALYGSAFAMVADSCCTRRDNWLVCGSKPDIEAFPDTVAYERSITGWPQKPCRFVISYKGRILSADERGITISE